MKAGFGMNIIGIIVVTLSINTIGLAYYGLDSFPSWASFGQSGGKCGGVTAALATTNSTAINVTTTITTKLI